MTNYLQQRVGKRLVASSVVMVIAFCLQWSGVLRMAGISNDAASRVILSNFDMVISESVMVGFAHKLTSDWLAIVGLSAISYALVFAFLAWMAWDLLSRRVMTGVAAAGMFSTFAFGLPFLPAEVFVKAYTGHELSYYTGDTTRVEGMDVAVPFSGKVPFFDIAALADENVGPQSVQEGEVEDSGDRTFDAYYQLAFMALQAVQLLNVLIGIGFWLVLGGLAYLTFARARVEENGPAGS